jgi:Cof subfamily protein (haloacid dehalogenase superfamily)
MSIKLVAFDLDGTVLRKDKTISERTNAAMRQAVSRGCVVLPASGRVLATFPEQALKIPGVRFVLTSNGASVLDLQQNKAIYSDLMTAEETEYLIHRLYEAGCFVEAYFGGKSYSDRLALPRLLAMNPPDSFMDFLMRTQTFVDNLPQYASEHGFRLEKVNVPLLPQELFSSLSRELEETGMFTTCSSMFGNLEINRAGCSKAKGLSHLCDLLGITRQEVMALGDSGNDLEMLQFAGLGIAMKNATSEVLAAADYITAANDEDGVALSIEKFVLA